LSVLQRCSDHFRTKLSDEQLQELPFSLESYNLTENSSFLDIGSGFGKPVFHAAMQTHCYSKGIEVVPARVAYCLEEKYHIEDEYKKKKTRLQKLAAKTERAKEESDSDEESKDD